MMWFFLSYAGENIIELPKTEDKIKELFWNLYSKNKYQQKQY